MIARLTKRTVEAAEPDPARDTFLWDADLRGFGLRTTRAGAKSYVIQYRNAEGKTRRMTIAPVGTLTTEEARGLAREKLARAVQGADPAQEKSDRRTAPTVRDLAERFDAAHIAVHLKPATAGEYRRIVRDFIVPALGGKPVAAVTRAEVMALHHSLRETPRQANIVVAITSKMFTTAEVWALRPEGTNPCRFVQRFRENRRQRYLSAPELGRLGETLASMEKTGDLTPYAALLFRLLLLTGMRCGEVLTLRWAEIDVDSGLVTLSDSKTGAKTIILGTAARELLKRAPREPGSPWVVTGARRNAFGEWTHLANPSKAWQRIKRRASEHQDGKPDVDLKDVTIHDLRHTFAALGAGGGLGLPVLGALLGHATPAVTARYAHIADSPLRSAADRVAADVAALLDGREPASVVPLKQKRAGKRRRKR